jgi:hypothetical protein
MQSAPKALPVDAVTFRYDSLIYTCEVLWRDVPAGPLEGAQDRLRAVERGADSGQRAAEQVMENYIVIRLR